MQHVVIIELHHGKIPRNVTREQIFQRWRIAVKRPAKVANAAFLFLFKQIFEHAVLFVNGLIRLNRLYCVQQIVIEIFYLAFFKLLFKNFPGLLPCGHKKRGHFVGQIKALAGVVLQGLANDAF